MTNLMAEAETKSAHTPGPWFQVWNGHFWDISLSDAPYSQSFAAIHANRAMGQTEEEVEANARLIAAAPTMLAALKTARDAMEASGGWEGDEDVFALIVAAIQRAEA